MRTRIILQITLGFSLSVLLACGEPEAPISSSPSAIDTTPQSTINIDRLISAGPSLTFNGMTGGVNAIALNPTNGSSAIAYYDKSSTATATTASGALKFAYQDSSGAWHIEMVDANYGTAACGTANSYCLGAPNTTAGNNNEIISLAFKSTGEPAIAYVYGASANTTGGYKQIRFAERSASGVWTINVAFQSPTATLATNVAVATIDPMKAVNLVFDSSDRPHITYAFYAQTAITNSKLKYSFRSSDLVWSTSDIQTIVTAGTLTALNQGSNQSGLEWCGASGPVGTSFVVDATAGSGKLNYIRCTTLATNGACSTWSTQALQNGCSGSACFSGTLLTTSNAGNRSEIAIRPDNKIALSFYSTATPNTSLLYGVSPATCDSAQGTTAGSWGAISILGSASQGATGLDIATSSTETFIMYLTSTTKVSIDKCTTASCTFFGSATAPAIETTTVGHEGVGLVYNSSNDMLYSTYAKLPAAAATSYGNDIMIAAGTPASLVASANLPFSYLLVDNLGKVFPNTAIPTLTTAKSSLGLIGYAYFYQDATAADAKLYYGFRGGSSSEPVFSSSFVTSHQESAAAPGFVGAYPSLVFASGNDPIIAYYNGADKRLEVAQSPDGGSSFSISIIDDHATNDLGSYPSVDYKDGVTGVSYYDATNTGLKFAKRAGAGWRVFAVDGIAGTGSCGNASGDAGKFSRLKFTSTGQPVIVYQMDTSLRLAFAAEAPTSTTYTWTCLTLDASGNTHGSGIDFKLSSTDLPLISHFQSTTGSVRLVTCNSAIASCVADSSLFVAEEVDGIGTTSLISTTPSVVVSSTDDIYVSYYSETFQGVTLAKKTASTGLWTKEYFDRPNEGSTFTGLGGQYANVLLNDSELPILIYRSKENWIKYLGREYLN